ncbi:MAG: hypothetical protein KDJ36_04140 [Hyphomicrobiaceae bacterium]|nr:hypothetical protein [Hyphomicrobiaceae bacterium]
MPRSVRFAVVGAASLLVAGAIYLMIVRGPVMLLDLANGAAKFLCL